MNRFVHETKTDLGSVPYNIWVPEKLRKAQWSQSTYKVLVTLPKGHSEVRPISTVGILVTDLFRPRGASENSWQGTPVEFLDYDMAMISRVLKDKPYPHVPFVGVEYKSTIVPLGFPANEAAWELVLQNAREWSSGGGCETDLSKEHLINMQMHVLKDIVVQAATATKVSDQKRLVSLACALAVSISSYYKDPENDVARKAIDAMSNCAIVEDALQRMLSLSFSPSAPTDRELLEILELSLKRAYRRLEKNSKKTILSNFVCLPVLYLGFLIRQLIQGALEIDSVRTKYESFVANVTKLAQNSKYGMVTMDQDVVVIGALIKSFGLKRYCPNEVLIKFVQYCQDSRNFLVWAPLESFKMIDPSPAPSFGIVSAKDLSDHGRSVSEVYFDHVRSSDQGSKKDQESVKDQGSVKDQESKKRVVSWASLAQGQAETKTPVPRNLVDRVLIKSTNPQHFSGVYITNGSTVCFEPQLFGLSEAKTGLSKATRDSENLAALWRVCIGPDVGGNGVASTGVLTTGERIDLSGAMKFCADKPLTVFVDSLRFTVKQQDATVTLKKSATDKIVFCFRNLTVVASKDQPKDDMDETDDQETSVLAWQTVCHNT